MGLSFRRRIKIAPGLRLNLSRSGPSLSVGPRGAHVTVGHGRVSKSVRVAKGLYWRQQGKRGR